MNDGKPKKVKHAPEVKKRVSKRDLIEMVHAEGNYSRKDISSIFDSLLKSIEERLVNGEWVTIYEFGGFAIHERKARAGVIPSTRKPIQVKKRKALLFKTSKTLNRKLNPSLDDDN